MPRFEIDVDPCDHITADAIGSSGSACLLSASLSGTAHDHDPDRKSSIAIARHRR